MLTKIRKIQSIALIFFIVFSLTPTICKAILAMKTETVSGILLVKNDDNSIQLDNGITYYPSRTDLVVSVEVGNPITLRFVVNSDSQKVFIESAPGINALEPSPAPQAIVDNTPK